jgi:friend leukemia integration 1 transcription factor
MPAIKSEHCMTAGLGGTAGDWAAGCAYRFACNSSTFEQLKQSVEKAKAALQDRSSYLAASSAFSDLADSPFAPPPRNSAVTQDPLQDARREDAITSVSDKRTHSKYYTC